MTVPHIDAPGVPASPASPASPAEVLSTRVDGAEVLGALSPSRAGDFLSCPLLYRFRSVDRLPEPPSRDAARGTVVHRVLELLYDLPAIDRTPERAEGLVRPAWAELSAQEPELLDAFAAAGAPALEPWLASCDAAVRRYFDLEDPRRLEPAERELYVETLLESKLLLRGFVDRVDIRADGAIRIVDYKTGRAPGVGFEGRALFQLKFYALAIWRERGVVPEMLQLVYLGDGELIRYSPDVDDLLATQRKVEAIWAAISLAHETGEWQPSPEPALRVVCPPGPVPRVRWHPATPARDSGAALGVEHARHLDPAGASQGRVLALDEPHPHPVALVLDRGDAAPQRLVGVLGLHPLDEVPHLCG